jgi:anti-sigma B factor antagonist
VSTVDYDETGCDDTTPPDDDAPWLSAADEVPAESLTIAVVAASAPTDWAIISLNGEVDVASAPNLNDAVGSVTGPGARLILDLTGVSFMDSTGLSALIRTFKMLREAGGELRIVAAGTRVTKLFEVTKLDLVFATYPSVAAAQMTPPATAN